MVDFLRCTHHRLLQLLQFLAVVQLSFGSDLCHGCASESPPFYRNDLSGRLCERKILAPKAVGPMSALADFLNHQRMMPTMILDPEGKTARHLERSHRVHTAVLLAQLSRQSVQKSWCLGRQPLPYNTLPPLVVVFPSSSDCRSGSYENHSQDYGQMGEQTAHTCFPGERRRDNALTPRLLDRIET